MQRPSSKTSGHERSLFFALVCLLCACQRSTNNGTGNSAQPSASAASAVASAAKPASEGSACLTQFDFLSPFEKYGEADLVRAIAVDGDQVYFRNMQDVFRVPLAGGPKLRISSTPGATLELDSHPSIWIAGERLLSQSPGDPAFLASPKAGGAWTPIVDLTRAHAAGKQTETQHLLQGIFGGSRVHAHPAIFDGSAFFWVEGKGSKQSGDSWSIRTVAMNGGDAKTLYASSGRLSSLRRAGEHLVFSEASPAPKPATKPARTKGPKKFELPPPAGPSFLMSLPVAGGTPERLARISNLTGNLGASEILLSDGELVYVSGYENEDYMKPGIYRIPASGGALELVDRRNVRGEGFIVGDQLVIAGAGPFEPMSHKPGENPLDNLGIVVLAGARSGKSLARVACIRGRYTAHAYAVAGKSVLIALFNETDRTSGIVRIALP